MLNPDDFFGPLTKEDLLASMNAACEDLAYGRELEDNEIVGFAGVRFANAEEALESAGYYPYWDEKTQEWRAM